MGTCAEGRVIFYYLPFLSTNFAVLAFVVKDHNMCVGKEPCELKKISWRARTPVSTKHDYSPFTKTHRQVAQTPLAELLKFPCPLQFLVLGRGDLQAHPTSRAIEYGRRQLR